MNNTVLQLEYALVQMLCERHEAHQRHSGGKQYVVKWNMEEDKKEEAFGKGILFSIRSKIEDKTIFKTLLLYAPYNYVFVFERDFGDNMREATSETIKPNSNWIVRSYHDSCWRDAVKRFIMTNQIDGPGFLNFTKEFTMTKEMFEFMKEKDHERRNLKT